MTQNPLLAPVSDLIDYAAVKPGHIEPAITALINESRQAVEASAQTTLAPTWEAIVEPLADATEKLWRAWSVAANLTAVVTTTELRAAYNHSLPQFTAFSTWVGLRPERRRDGTE